jgi:colicin import membrane protein
MSTEVAVIPPKPLTVIERTAAVFTSVPSEDDLRELAKKSATITEITNEAGKDQCHASRMVLKNTRLEIERVGEEGREDAVQTSKAIIARQKALIGITKPEEDRLAAIQKTWDERIAAEKEAKIQAEIARVANINGIIDGIRGWPILATNKPSARVAEMVARAESFDIAESVFEEHAENARTVLASSLAALRGLHTAAVEAEQKAIQLKRDQEELARLRADQAKRDKEAREAQAKADADAKTARDAETAKQAAIDKANRERNEAALQEIQAIHHQLIIADTGRRPYCKGGDLESIDWVIDGTEKWELTEERFGALYPAAVKAKETTLTALRTKRANYITWKENEAERQRLIVEQAETDKRNELERQRNAEEAGKVTAARQQLERDQETARKAAEPKPEPPKVKTIERPSAEVLVQLIANHYGISQSMAVRWLVAAKLELESAAA